MDSSRRKSLLDHTRNNNFLRKSFGCPGDYNITFSREEYLAVLKKEREEWKKAKKDVPQKLEDIVVRRSNAVDINDEHVSFFNARPNYIEILEKARHHIQCIGFHEQMATNLKRHSILLLQAIDENIDKTVDQLLSEEGALCTDCNNQLCTKEIHNFVARSEEFDDLTAELNDISLHAIGMDDILRELLSEDVLQKPHRASSLLQSVEKTLHGTLEAVEASVYTAQLLNPSDGIPQFILKVYQKAQIDKPSTKQAFDLMEYVIVNFSDFAELLSDRIISWCLVCLSKNIATDAKVRVGHLATAALLNCPCVRVNWSDVFSDLKAYFLSHLKLPATLIESIFALMGAICKKHPELAEQYSKWFFDQIEIVFNLCSHDKTVSANTLSAAAFAGLAGAMVHFTPSNLSIVYNNVKNGCMLRIHARNTSTRLALEVFTLHASHFAVFVVEDYKFWCEQLSCWISDEQPSEHKRVGLAALNSLYRAIANHLITDNAANANEIFFYFKNYIEKPSSSMYRLKTTLSALCELSDVYFRRNEETNLMLATTTLIAQVESLALEIPFMVGIQLETLSKIYSSSRTADRSKLPQVAVSFIENYPKIEYLYQSDSLQSLEKSFCEWIKSGDVDMVLNLDTVMYQGLLRSSAFPIFCDVQLLQVTEIQEKLTSYKDFISLWIHLLTINSREQRDGSVTFNQQNVGKVVFNSFMKSFLCLISKLNLKLIPIATDCSDPSASLEAECPSDFQIFVNLVDLFQDVLPKSDSAHLTLWLPEIISLCLKFARDSSFISGFYKIIAICFQVAGDDNFEVVDINGIDDFLHDSIVLVDSQKEDLLIANLRMIFLVPHCYIKNHVHLLPKVVSTACRVGRGYTEMLCFCIDALERWHTQLPLCQIKPVVFEGIKNLAPCILKPVSGIPQSELRDRKVTLTSKGKIKKRIAGPGESRTLKIQKQFLMFMAKIDPSLCLEALQPDFRLVVNDTQLIYKLPMPDRSLEIDLSRLIPRVIELVLASSDRDARFTACQLLHSLVLITLGRIQSSTRDMPVIKQLATVCLTLSCDSDNLVRTLFNPLMLQMARYFSNTRNAGSKECALFIEVLFEGITHLFDSALRDFAAKCLKEFLFWSKNQGGDDPSNRRLSINTNMVAIVKVICDFVVHPNSSKRQGATIAFNMLYDKIRENKEVVTDYWLRLHHSFLICLKMATTKEESQFVKTAVEHINRPFHEKTHLFLKPANNRSAMPPEYGDGTIMDVAIVSMKHCRSSNPYMRDASQKFMNKLIRKLPGFDSLRDFMEQKMHLTDFYQLENDSEIGEVLAVIDFTQWLWKGEPLDEKLLITRGSLEEAAHCVILKFISNEIPSLQNISILLQFLREANYVTDDMVQTLAKLLTHNKLSLDDQMTKSELIKFLFQIKKDNHKLNILRNNLSNMSPEQFREVSLRGDVKEFAKFWRVTKLLQELDIVAQYSENCLFNAVFDNIFKSMRSKIICQSLDRQLLIILEDIVKHTLDHCLRSTQYIIELLTDTSEVLHAGKKTTKGDYIFGLFKNEFVPCLVKTGDVNMMISVGLKWIQSILQCLISGIKAKSANFLLEILAQWRNLERKGGLSELLVILKLISKLKVSEKDMASLKPWYFSIPGRDHLAINEIVSWFELLPSFCSEGEESADINRTLPLFEKWLRFAQGSRSEKSDLVATQKRVMQALISCICENGNLSVFKFMLDVAGQNPLLISEKALVYLCERVSSKRTEIVTSMLNVLHLLIFHELVLKDSSVLVSGILKKVLVCVPKLICVSYFTDKLIDIHKVLDFPVTLRKERDLLRKWVAVDLLVILFDRTEREDRNDIKNTLTAECAENQTLFNNIIKACVPGSLKLNRPSAEELELLRQLNCSYVNLTFQLITALPTEEKCNQFFFFKANESRSFWPHVVDDSCNYQLRMEFSQRPPIRRIKTLIKKLPCDLDETVEDSVRSYANSHSATLSDSSLSEDVRNFDLTNVHVFSRSLSHNDNSNMELELELDQLNKHEIVPNFCALARVLTGKNIFCWVNFLLHTLNEKCNSRNTKLLVLKILYNLDLNGLMENHNLSSKFGAVILETILNLCDVTNYLLLDMVIMLLSWNVSLEGSTEQLNELVKLLIENPGSERKDALKVVLEVVEKCVESWRMCLNPEVLTKIVFDGASLGKAKEILNYRFIRFASILLANDIFVLDIRIKTLLDWLLWVEKNESSNRQLASETLGQALAKICKKSEFEDVAESVRHDLNMMPSERLVMCLYYVNKFCPNVCASFIGRVHSQAYNERSVLKGNCLEIILSFVKTLGNLGDNLTTGFAKFAEDSLKCGMLMAQLTMLKIIHEVVENLDIETISYLTQHIIDLSDDGLREIRLSACQVLIKVMKVLPGNGSVESSKCKVALLRRLNDPDEEIRGKCLEFWCNDKIPQTISDRILYIISELYHPDAESEFVEYAIRILLQASFALPAYHEYLFDEPLGNCDFHEQQWLSLLRTKHTMPAMFAPSLSTELGRLDENLSGGTLTLRLRETARSLKFTPTLADSNGMTYSTFAKPSASLEKPNKAVKKRPMRIATSSKSFYVHRHSKNVEKEMILSEELSKQHEDKVTMYRSYRTGDYPDIQIKNSEFIDLLVGIISKDSQLAKELLIAITNDTFTWRLKENRRDLTNCLNYFVSSSHGEDPMAVSAVFEIAISHRLCLSSKEIDRLAAATGLLSSGAIVLERWIENVGEEEEPEEFIPSKKMKNDENNYCNHWLRLAQNYHRMKDANAVRGIFLDKLNIVGPARNAILAEISLDWKRAKVHYAQVLEDKTNSIDRAHFYNQSYINCLANLSDWTAIVKCINDSVKGDKKLLWDDPWCSEVLLPWQMKARVMTGLSDITDTLSDLNNSNMDKRFTEEMAIAYWLQGDIAKTISTCNQGVSKLIKTWSIINDWDFNLKKSFFNDLQIHAEIQKLVAVSYNKIQSETLSKMLQRSVGEIPNEKDNIVTWDVRLALQRRLFTYISTSLEKEEFKKRLVDNQLSFANVAVMQNNIDVARNCLKIVKKHDNNHANNPRWLHIRRLASFVEVQNIAYDNSTKIEQLNNLWNLVEGDIEKFMNSDEDNQNLAYSSRLILNIISKIASLKQSGGSIDLLSPDKRNLKGQWTHYAEKALNATAIVENQGEIYVEMASFYKKNIVNCRKPVVLALLKAMQCGNKIARQLFGETFTMSGNIDNEEVQNECDRVPTWMFLLWRQQLLAYLSGSSFKIGRNVLLRIALEFPAALSCPLRLSIASSRSDELIKSQFIKKLSDLSLTDSAEERFIMELNQLANPWIKVAYLLNNVYSALTEEHVDWLAIDKLVNFLRDIFVETKGINRVLSLVKDDFTSLWSCYEARNVDILRDIAQNFQKVVRQQPASVFDRLMQILENNSDKHRLNRSEVQEQIGNLQMFVDYANLYDYNGALENLQKGRLYLADSFSDYLETSTAVENLTIGINILKKCVNQMKGAQFKPPKRLDQYSSWLYRYHWLSVENHLYIPGQFDTNSEPRPSSLIKIASLKPEVLPQHSKTQPIRLTLVGNDAREYSFLVKFGEDLRQDERIQQVLGQMQSTLIKNKATADIRLDGYSVFPLTPTMGMIQWVEGAQSLGYLMSGSSDLEKKKFENKNHEVRVAHLKFLGPSQNGAAAILNGYVSHSAEDLICKYEECVSNFDPFLLRQGLWQLSSSPQQFFGLRSNLASSLGAMSIAHWILGVGDRHLENTIISTSTGRSVGIDFGMAFGSATQFLPVPELMPFRLTPQLRNVFSPMLETGWLKHTMIDTLNCLREDSAVLLAMLEVFVLEPCVDWVQQSKRVAKDQGDSISNNEWYPRGKIDRIVEKLSGGNPIADFEINLKTGRSENLFLLKQLEVLKGRPGRFRHETACSGLSADKQVGILIDLATDPLILSLIWVGWSPWL